jgi:glycosyltransferase involved in cell wall biosynthesis
MTADARRVLIIVQNLPVPFDRRVWLEATTLTAHGYRVSVICPKAKGFNSSFEVIEDVDIYRYPLPIDAKSALCYAAEFVWCFVASALLSLRVALFGRGFDVLHVCNPPETFWPLGLFWRAFGKVFLFDHHDLSPEMFAVKFDRSDGLLHRALLWLERRTFRAAQIVVTTNESHRQVAITRGGKQTEDIFIVRSGPDMGRFRRYEPSLEWHHGKPFLLAYLGEICVQDGVDYLLRSIVLLRDTFERRDFHCVIIGGGPHQPAIKELASTMGVGDLVTFTGRVSDEQLCRILSSATIGIDPGPKNPWSERSTMNKVIEYMYFGLPVVAFDLHETRVSAGDAGRYATANSEHDLALEIDKLLADEAERQVMSRAAEARVREQLAWNHSVPVLLAAYDRAFACLDPARPAALAAQPRAD